MHIPSLLVVAIMTAAAQQVAGAQQTLEDAQFQVRYSASGVTSVTRVQDRPLQALASLNGEDQEVRVEVGSNGASITITRQKSFTSLLRVSPVRRSPEGSTSKLGLLKQ